MSRHVDLDAAIITLAAGQNLGLEMDCVTLRGVDVNLSQFMTTLNNLILWFYRLAPPQ